MTSEDVGTVLLTGAKGFRGCYVREALPRSGWLVNGTVYGATERCHKSHCNLAGSGFVDDRGVRTLDRLHVLSAGNLWAALVEPRGRGHIAQVERLAEGGITALCLYRFEIVLCRTEQPYVRVMASANGYFVLAYYSSSFELNK